MPNPMWTWCPLPGAARDTKLNVDTAQMGDGYTHRSTRGLNPARPTWTLQFPFASNAQLKAIDDFLKANAAAGFYMQPPDLDAPVFVTVDEWSATISDRSPPGDMVGTLQATFTQQFNPQPAPVA